MATRSVRRRRVEAELIFNGQAVSYDLLPSLWRQGQEHREYSNYRRETARGLRTKTMTIRLKESWKRRHPDAAEWVVKVLPERRTLERDLIASSGAVEPYYDRVAIGKQRGMDFDNAEACANYMETWRKESIDAQKIFEKDVEDGECGQVILPTDIDLGGRPDIYDRIEQDAYDALDEDAQAEYAPATIRDPDTDDERPHPRGGFYRVDKDGARQKRPPFDADDEKKRKAAEDEALTSYLLKQEQDAISVRIIPAGDVVPYMTRGTKRQPWKTVALLERTLYYPTELPAEYGWQGMGDRLLIPSGFEATRTSGQNGMYYLYTLYMTWRDTTHPDPQQRRIERPLVIYSVGGFPTWEGDDPPADKELPDNGVVVLDLYERYGLTGPFWRYGGGLHTSDDSFDFYYEPYMWPFVETILGIEGLSTMGNAATSVQAVTGYYYRPDAALMTLDDEALVDAQTQTLRVPNIPDAGEIETLLGEIMLASPAQVSPDLWRVIQLEMMSLRENTALEQPGSDGSASGRSMVVKETIAQTTKRHIREDVKEAVKFLGERAMRIYEALDQEFNVRWPLQTTKEAPVGQQMRESSETLVWDSAWVGDGEYRLTCEYPSEPDPIRVEQAMSKIAAGVGSFEELCEASGITDVESEWARVLKTQLRMMPEYRLAQLTRLAKRQGNTLMIEVLKLQQQQKLSQQGAPGFEEGLPTAALRRPGEAPPTGIGGPTTTERSIGGMMSGATGPQKQEAMLTAQIPGAA